MYLLSNMAMLGTYVRFQGGYLLFGGRQAMYAINFASWFCRKWSQLILYLHSEKTFTMALGRYKKKSKITHASCFEAQSFNVKYTADWTPPVAFTNVQQKH